MNIANVAPGKYVVAVSGGVDSCALLHILRSQSGLELIVAHFDHGIRDASAKDADFVRQLAATYGLPFVSERAELGATASEAAARIARYAFLERAKAQHHAQAIITAHHQDDLIETALINLHRGTGWRGLCSLRDTPERRRPLLQVSKTELVAFATAHHLQWREDSTNTDTRYLRNRIRHKLISVMTPEIRQQLLALIARQTELRTDIEQALACLHDPANATIPRALLILSPAAVAKEVLLAVVYKLARTRVEGRMLTRMLWFAKTGRLYKTLQVSAHIELFVDRATVVVRTK